MNDKQSIAELDPLLDLPFYLTGSQILLEILAVVLLFSGVIILSLHSKRPGRLMMLSGLGLATICLLPAFLISSDALEALAIHKLITWYLPLFYTLFVCLGCFGFFKFALSYKSG